MCPIRIALIGGLEHQTVFDCVETRRRPIIGQIGGGRFRDQAAINKQALGAEIGQPADVRGQVNEQGE